jgi:hypothetical protein
MKTKSFIANIVFVLFFSLMQITCKDDPPVVYISFPTSRWERDDITSNTYDNPISHTDGIDIFLLCSADGLQERSAGSSSH